MAVKNLIEWLEEAENKESILIARALVVAITFFIALTGVVFLSIAVPYFWIVWPVIFVLCYGLLFKYAMRNPKG